MRLQNFVEWIGPHGGHSAILAGELQAQYHEFHQFDFGDLSALPEQEVNGISEYCRELIAEGLFELPFKNVAYSFLSPIPNKKCAHYLVIAQYIGCGMRVTVASKVNTVVWFDVALADDSDHWKVVRSFIGELTDVEASAAEEIIGSALRCLFTLTCLLHARGVTIEVDKAPERLNAKRMRAGKLPIGDVNRVIVVIGGVKHSIAGKPTGNHASPRLHWRRGHVRRLGGRIVNIRPCLVGGASSESGDVPPPRLPPAGNYIIRYQRVAPIPA